MTQIERLVKIYVDSRARLLKEIEKRILWGRSTYAQDLLLREIDKEIKRLNLESYAWADEAVKEAYMKAAKAAYLTAHSFDQSIKPFASFGGLHKKAISVMAHNTQDYLAITNSLIARQAGDRVREIGIEIISQKFGEGLTVQETRRALIERFRQEDFVSVPWRNGRGSMRVDSYSELVARTTTREATMTATYNQSEALGHHLYKMTSHATTCKVCASRQGRVYRSIDYPAGDIRNQFPRIEEGFPRWPTYKTVHPNCSHVAVTFIWDQKTEAEQQAALARAAEPFNHDPRSEAERQRYEEGQRKNRERMRDRKQWEKYREVLGKENVPSFSGFRAMKKSGNENWQFMQLDYKRQNRLITHPELALPNAMSATAADAKFTGYLFNFYNHDGWAKGVAFDSRLGYNASNWQTLQKRILQSATRYPVTLRGEDVHGASYEQQIVLYGLKRKPANVIIGWKAQDKDVWMTTAYIREVNFYDKN